MATNEHVALARDSPPTAATAAPPDSTPAIISADAYEITFPLNSRRLTGLYLRSIAKAIGLPATGTVEQTRVIIDGKLTEMGRDLRNVQVVVRSWERGETLLFRDMDGAFVEASVSSDDRGGTGIDGGDGDGEHSESGAGEDLTISPHSSTRASEDEELSTLRAANEALLADKEALNGEVSSLKEEVSEVRGMLERERERVGEMWRMNCAQVAGFDKAITAKNRELDLLRSIIAELEVSAGRAPATVPIVPDPDSSTREPASSLYDSSRTHSRTLRSSNPAPTPVRRGKAPPVSRFSGEDPECLLEDWLPSLNRASLWNGWSEEEQMIQLAEHLKGRALQEWNLIHADQRTTFAQATEALRLRLDTASKTVAAQEFRHTAQREGEAVSDFIRRLERTFRSAYGRDGMSVETRDTLLYGQLQEGLRLKLMRGPAVSGAATYQELCIAARNEEKRFADLKKRQEYSHSHITTTPRTQRQFRMAQSADDVQANPTGGLAGTTLPSGGKVNLKCFYCGKTGHRKADCRRRQRDQAQPSESRGPSRSAATKQVRSQHGDRHSPLPDASSPEATSQPQHSTSPETPPVTTSAGQDAREPGPSEPSPLELLFSDSDGEGVKQVQVPDCGSRPHLARVVIHGVPADGIIDTAADITIMSGKLFALVAAVAKLRKRNFRKSDRIPGNYDGREFHLDGCMEMNLTFQDTTLSTTVYVKMDAIDQLLLSEGVCRQQGIVWYHPSVTPRETQKSKRVADVPSIRMMLAHSLKLPPSQRVPLCPSD